MKATAARKEQEYRLQAVLHGVKLKKSGITSAAGEKVTSQDMIKQLRMGQAKGLPIKFGKKDR